MAEYIDRDKIINKICNEKCHSEYGKCQKGRHGDKIVLCVCDFIRLQEAADVAPVVHGRWIRMPSDIGTIDVEECSICGCGMTERNQFWNAKFCPESGARME